MVRFLSPQRSLVTVHVVFLLSLVALAVSGAQDTGQAPVTAATPAYRLEAGDTIDIRFFYNPELNERVQIRPDGNISMPLLGDISAARLTVAGLTSDLNERYKTTLKQPAAHVQILTYANRKIFVGGEVARPGMFPLVGEQTVLGAVLEAGGLKASANKSRLVLIRRTPDGTPSLQQIALAGGTKLDLSPAAALRLQPFDAVIALESGIGRANRVVDQYVRQLLPLSLSGGFSYLVNGGFLQ